MRDTKKNKYGMAILALALTIVLCLGGFHLYKEFIIKKPLETALLEIKGVQQVQIDEHEKNYLFLISLQNTQDLKGIYQAADSIIQESLGKESYEIIIDEKSSAELEELFGELELGIYQGMANGSFLWLAEWMESRTGPREINCHLQVDSRNIYLTMNDDTNYICRIIKRNGQDSYSSEEVL
ncbi:MAG: hypothetical protein GXY50_04710 [Syntrophomonadaceae bacterium]|nr:hypothetical protein [Syntrophomonadaceae bacterium]